MDIELLEQIIRQAGYVREGNMFVHHAMTSAFPVTKFFPIEKTAPVSETKTDCSEHKKEVAGISDMKILAEMIGDLHYQTLEQLFFELQTKLHNDSIKDIQAERFKLSHHLHRASKFIFEASIDIGTAWIVSKRYMEKKPPTK